MDTDPPCTPSPSDPAFFKLLFNNLDQFTIEERTLLLAKLGASNPGLTSSDESAPDNSDSSDTEFKLPKKRSRHSPKKLTTSTPSTSTNNRFAPLATQPDDSSNPQLISQHPPIPNSGNPPQPQNISQPTPSTSQVTPKPVSIPPIILRDHSKWIPISKSFDSQNIHYLKARFIPEGIKIFPSSINDFRLITSFFDTNSIPYHTFSLSEEKSLKVVLRGIPDSFTPEDIASSLISTHQIPVSKIIRMTKRHPTIPNTRIPIPLVIAIVPTESRRIYDITKVCGITIRIEPLKNTPSLGQCHRCQLFGHAQSRCTAPPMCVKCGANHITSSCSKAFNEPPTCSNCSGPHTANFRGCPHFIKHLQQQRPHIAPNPWTRAPNLFTPPPALNPKNLPTLPPKSAHSLPQPTANTPPQIPTH